MKELICIICPNGCHLTIDDELNVSGNNCPRGAEYAKNEVICPKRSLTSTVKLLNSDILSVLPVRTTGFIPKDKIFDVMKAISMVKVYVPVAIGQVIIKNVLDLGVDIVASRGVDR